MDQNLKDKVLENLTKAENIAIVVAKGAGFDGLAAGLALYLSLVKLDKNVSVIAKPPTVGDGLTLYGVDKIGQMEGTKTPVVVVENAIETVDKVTYFLDKTKLKVVIHPLPGTPPIKSDDIKIEYNSMPASLIFTIGIDNLHDLRSEFTHEQEISPEAWIINVSNLQPSQKFAQIDVVNTQAGGVSEVTAKMLQDMALPVDEDIAFNLYCGLRASSNNFSPNLVSPLSLEVASWLLKFGAGRANLAKTSPSPTPRTAIATMAPPSYQTFMPPTQTMPTDIDIDQLEDEDFYQEVPPIEEVEAKEVGAQEAPKSGDWLKPPKIYKGSKSLGGENKG